MSTLRRDLWRILTTYRSVWLRVALVLVVVMALVIVGLGAYAQALGPWVVGQLEAISLTGSGWGPLLLRLGLPVLAVVLLLGYIWAGVTAYVADRALRDLRASTMRSVWASLRRAPRAFGASVIWLVSVAAAVALTPAFVLVGVLGLLAALVLRVLGSSERRLSVRTLAVFAVPFLPAIVVLFRFVLTLPAIWLDDHGVSSGLRQSWQRVGRRPLYVAVVSVASALFTGGVFWGAWWLGGRFAESGAAIGQLVAQVLVGATPLIAAVVMYRELESDDPAPELVDVAPMPGAGRRRAVLTVSIAMIATQLVLVAGAGTAVAQGPDLATVNVWIIETQPVAAGAPVAVFADVQGPVAEGPGCCPQGRLSLQVEGVEIGFIDLTGVPGVTLTASHSFNPGSHTVTAVYDGDATFAAGTAEITVVAVASSITTMTVSSSPSVFGNTITLRAEVVDALGGPAPTGFVRFLDLGPGLATTDIVLTNGIAELVSTGEVFPGTYTVTAQYNPDGSGSHESSSSVADSLIVTSAPTIVGLVLSPPSPSDPTSPVIAAVEVVAPDTTALPTGNIDIIDNGVVIAVGAVLDQIPLTLAPGTHTIEALYQPHVGFEPSAATRTHTVSKFESLVVLTSSASTSIPGDAVTMTATVDSAAGFIPSGDVEFFATLDSGTVTPLGVVAVDGAGIASVALPLLAVGSYTVTAAYLGDDTFTAGTATPLGHVIGLAPAQMTLRVAESVPRTGEDITAVINLSAPPPSTETPLGRVTLTEDGVIVGSAHAVGDPLTIVYPATGGGLRTLVATFEGNSLFGPTTATVDVFVFNQRATLDVFGPRNRSIDYGDVVYIEGALSGQLPTLPFPTGDVTLFVNGTAVDTATLNAVGRFVATIDDLPAQSDAQIFVQYDGDLIYGDANSSNTADLVHVAVAKAASNPDITFSTSAPMFGAPITLEVTLNEAGVGPTGTVTFSTIADGVIGSAPVINGTASLETSFTARSTGVFAAYSGDQNFLAGATTTKFFSASAPTPSLVIVAPSRIPYGGVVPVVASISLSDGSPVTGEISFATTNGDALAGPVTIIDGDARFDLCGGDARICAAGLPWLGLGRHEIRASFAPTATVDAVASTAPIVVVPAATSLTLTTTQPIVSHGGFVVLRATVDAPGSSATPFGRVDFLHGQRFMGSAEVVDGVAVLNVTAGTDLRYPAVTATAEFFPETGLPSFWRSSGSTPLEVSRRSVRFSVQADAARAFESGNVLVSLVSDGSDPQPDINGWLTIVGDEGQRCEQVYRGRNLL